MPDLHLDDLSSQLPGIAQSIETHYLQLSGWLASHLPRIGTLLACITLSLYGRAIADRARRLALEWPFILRVGLFVAVVGFGFSLIIASVAPLVTAGLSRVETPYLVPAVFACFLVVGILAERSGRI